MKNAVLLVGFIVLAGVAHAEEKVNEAAFVEAVDRVVKAVAANDYELFESYFAKVIKNMQPEEIWRGAFVVMDKFGNVHKLEFSELDEDSGGAFVRVSFERATRDVFVRLTEDNKIKELSYVPPLR